MIRDRREIDTELLASKVRSLRIGEIDAAQRGLDCARPLRRRRHATERDARRRNTRPFHAQLERRHHGGNVLIEALGNLVAAEPFVALELRHYYGAYELARPTVLLAVSDEEILKRKQERRDWTLRIWSAGCSTGPEPYTIAILVCDALAYYYLRNPLPFEMPTPKPLIPPPWKVEIIASDINYSALLTAQQGTYTESQMEPVDYTCRLRYFDKVGDKYTVKAALKSLVQFDFHNLKTEYLPQRNDAIFCRNVMIYFDEAEQKRLIEKFHRCLNPEGYLFVGHAESLFGLTTKFHMIHQNNATVYQRVEGAQ